MARSTSPTDNDHHLSAGDCSVPSLPIGFVLFAQRLPDEMRSGLLCYLSNEEVLRFADAHAVNAIRNIHECKGRGTIRRARERGGTREVPKLERSAWVGSLIFALKALA